MYQNADNRCLVFDFGGVLIEWDPRHLYRKMFSGDSQQMEYFLANICTPEWNHGLDLGRSFAEAVADLAGNYPEYADLIKAYHTRWEEMVPYAMDETVDILSDLHRSSHPLVALSNWSHETFPIMRRRFAFLEWFEHIVISGEARMAKPDPQFFEKALTVFGRAANECIFIDDSKKNIEVARKLGFDVIHFHSAQALREDLANRGLIGI